LPTTGCAGTIPAGTAITPESPGRISAVELSPDNRTGLIVSGGKSRASINAGFLPCLRTSLREPPVGGYRQNAIMRTRGHAFSAGGSGLLPFLDPRISRPDFHIGPFSRMGWATGYPTQVVGPMYRYCAIKPPSITNSVPVMNEASSEARNNTP